MLGVVVGALTRNPTTAMVAIFGVWIAEKIVGGWLGAGWALPPVHAASRTCSGCTSRMSWGYAALALAALTAALALVAQRGSVPRDVT